MYLINTTEKTVIVRLNGGSFAVPGRSAIRLGPGSSEVHKIEIRYDSHVINVTVEESDRDYCYDGTCAFQINQSGITPVPLGELLD